MKILVTGGAGYIGSFMVRRLIEESHEVTVLDSLEKGHKETIPQNVDFVEGNILDKEILESVFQKQFDAIIHFAGYISMGESVENPGKYFENNTFGSLYLIEQAVKQGVKNFIFSSTAGVYGNPTKIPIPEGHSKNPTNPYGQSKLMTEEILEWYSNIFEMNSVSLRYFNASGASLDGSLGENHYPETHLIPNVMNSILENKAFTLFGNDYPTKDGTCIRDYIHVIDLVEAHILALKKISEDGGCHAYNVGTGTGYSNKEVIEYIEKVSGRKVSIEQGPKRLGDAVELIADSSKINEELEFKPRYSDLETIVKTAWLWHENISKLKTKSSK